jgi:hypothetical protein
MDVDVRMDAIWVHHVGFNNPNEKQETPTY